MNKICFMLILFGLILLFGCSQETQVDLCNELENKLDEAVIETAHGDSRIRGREDVVGGTLIDISEPWFYVPTDEEQKKPTYTLTFAGKNKAGNLFLRTSLDIVLPYKINNFYKFDLENINLFSAQLSGAFMDPDANKLQLMDCE